MLPSSKDFGEQVLVFVLNQKILPLRPCIRSENNRRGRGKGEPVRKGWTERSESMSERKRESMRESMSASTSENEREFE